MSKLAEKLYIFFFDKHFGVTMALIAIAFILVATLLMMP
jgi:hypothetical protein